MKMSHIIIEGYCDGIRNDESLPCKGMFSMGAHCLECKEFSYSPAENEIAFAAQDGLVAECIGFGGEMEPEDKEKTEKCTERWNKICIQKINDAYDEYMSEQSSIR